MFFWDPNYQLAFLAEIFLFTAKVFISHVLFKLLPHKCRCRLALKNSLKLE